MLRIIYNSVFSFYQFLAFLSEAESLCENVEAEIDRSPFVLKVSVSSALPDFKIYLVLQIFFNKLKERSLLSSSIVEYVVWVGCVVNQTELLCVCVSEMIWAFIMDKIIKLLPRFWYRIFSTNLYIPSNSSLFCHNSKRI